MGCGDREHMMCLLRRLHMFERERLRALDASQQRKSVVARGDHERGKRRLGWKLTEANHAAKR